MPEALWCLLQVQVPRMLLPPGFAQSSCMLTPELAWLLSSRLPAKEVNLLLERECCLVSCLVLPTHNAAKPCRWTQ